MKTVGFDIGGRMMGVMGGDAIMEEVMKIAEPTPKMIPIEVLDKIRAEIDKQIEYNTYFNSDMAKGEIIAFEWVKRKIDEYTKGARND